MEGYGDSDLQDVHSSRTSSWCRLAYGELSLPPILLVAYGYADVHNEHMSDVR